MAIFDFLKEKKMREETVITFPALLGAVSRGQYVKMKEIPDEIFSTGVLGTCCGVEPEEGKVYAPIGGKISQVADTLHAVGIEAGGIELLIHVGIDTVDMKGRGFHVAVKEGQTVKKGDLLLEMDLEMIHNEGHPTVVIMAVTNSGDYAAVEETGSGEIIPGDNVLRVCK